MRAPPGRTGSRAWSCAGERTSALTSSTEVRARLGAPRRGEYAAGRGPATTLELIAERPVGARRRPGRRWLGRERLSFKRDVRKLKELGLTESLEVRLPPVSAWPRGARVVLAAGLS